MIKILVVDDEDNWHQAFKEAFYTSEYSLKLTKSTQEAKEKIKENNKFDIIIVNIHTNPALPSIETGLSLLRFIRDECSPYLARIAITAKPKPSFQETLLKFQSLDVDDILIKIDGLTIDYLREVVHNAVNKRKNGGSPAKVVMNGIQGVDIQGTEYDSSLLVQDYQKDNGNNFQGEQKKKRNNLKKEVDQLDHKKKLLEKKQEYYKKLELKKAGEGSSFSIAQQLELDKYKTDIEELEKEIACLEAQVGTVGTVPAFDK